MTQKKKVSKGWDFGTRMVGFWSAMGGISVKMDSGILVWWDFGSIPNNA